MSYIPVTVQKMDENEEWSDLLYLHAKQVNRAGGGEGFSAGRETYQPRLTFDFPWCKALEAVRWDVQHHRLMYQGHPLNITNYDDYMEQHLTVRLTGEAYG